MSEPDATETVAVWERCLIRREEVLGVRRKRSDQDRSFLGVPDRRVEGGADFRECAR